MPAQPKKWIGWLREFGRWKIVCQAATRGWCRNILADKGSKDADATRLVLPLGEEPYLPPKERRKAA